MKKCIVSFLFLSLFLSGCWDSRELDQLAIALAFGIDKMDDEYQVSAQVVVPSEMSAKGASGKSQVTLYKAKGKTVYEAFRKMTKDSPRKIYPGHLRMLVIGEELAKEGISESLDILTRDSEIRPDFFIVVTKDINASEILNVTTTLEGIPANKMFNSLQMSEKVWAGTQSINLDELVTDMISDGREAIMTGIRLVGNPQKGSSNENVQSITPAASLRYDNLAVFRGDRLVGWLTENETIAYGYVTNFIQTTVRPIDCPGGGNATIEVSQSNADVKGQVKAGKPKIDITINVKGNVGSVGCAIDLKSLKTINQLEENYEKEIEEKIKRAFDSVKGRYQADIFGFGEAIHRANPKAWKKMKDNWSEEFENLTMNVQVKLDILRTGTINDTFLQQLEKKTENNP